MAARISFLAVFITGCATAQRKNESADKFEKSKSRFEIAKKESRSGNYAGSLKIYDEILKENPGYTEARIRKASVLHNLHRYEEAVKEYRLAIDSNPDFDPEMYFSFALLYRDMKEYGAATDQFNQFLYREKEDSIRIQKAKQLSKITAFRHETMSNPVPFNPEKLPQGINTEYSEYTPSISLDGNTMIFTRRTGGQEDLYKSIRIDGVFSQSQPITEINTHRNEGAHCISADGKTIIFTACDRTDSYGGCDLYYAFLENDRWTRAFNLGKRINTPAYESQPCLSADGRTLYFSSNRTGGYGGKDIWFSKLDDDNRWLPPVNAGPEINTEENDETPFIHADGMTLYFRSDGRLGMGGYDIYYSRWDSVTNNWSTAVNIGYPINSERSEGGLIVSLDGTKAYFASDMQYGDGDSKANLDIYSFDMPESSRPVPSTYIKGQISDAFTGKALIALVSIVDLSTNRTLYKSSSLPDGSFITGIATGKNYACFAEMNGYIMHSQHFSVSELSTEKYYELDILLQPVPVDADAVSSQPVILENIFFDSGTASLKRESMAEINRLSRMVLSNPEIKIKITGHTDNVGSDKDNQILSENRAKAVYEALIDAGVSKDRITYEGKGENQPIESNETEAGRKRNRRTEFVIFK